MKKIRNLRERARREWRRMTPGLIPAAVVVLLAALAAHCSGCGGVSVEARTAYAVESARCVANERAIVDRVSTEEEDRRDIAIERARCDAALAVAEGRP